MTEAVKIVKPPNKFAAKFTPTEKEEVLAKVSQLDRRGWTQWEIAKEIGVSQSLVSVWLVNMRKEYIAQRMVDQAWLIEQKRQQYAELKKEAWLAWERSKEIWEKEEEVLGLSPGKKTKDSKTSKAPKDAEELTQYLRVIRITKTKEGRLPGAEYLAIILRCLEAERELDGLDVTKELKIKSEGSLLVDWDNMVKLRSSYVDEVENAITDAKKGQEGVVNNGNGEEVHPSFGTQGDALATVPFLQGTEGDR